MELILILGPMKSGKTHELIGYFAPLKYTKTTFSLYHPLKNVRDKTIWSRNGLTIEAKKIKSLKEIDDDEAEVIGIDEIHMFDQGDIGAIERLLLKGKRIIVSGLDLDHQRRLMPIIKRLFELGPSEVKYKKAACEKCRSYDAIYTLIYQDGKRIPPTMSHTIPDDGQYKYVVLCRRCYNNIS